MEKYETRRGEAGSECESDSMTVATNRSLGCRKSGSVRARASARLGRRELEVITERENANEGAVWQYEWGKRDGDRQRAWRSELYFHAWQRESESEWGGWSHAVREH